MEDPKFNELPPDYDVEKLGPQKRRTDFKDWQDKRACDARGLINEALQMAIKTGIEVPPVVFAKRKGDQFSCYLKHEIASEQKRMKSRELQPEEAERILGILEERFHSEKGQMLHPGEDWSRVKTALLLDKKALWSIHAMEENGHEPDVYFSDQEGFDVGTCSDESPAYGMNCVYSKAAAVNMMSWTNRIDQFNGSAEAMAEQMGVELMEWPKFISQLLKHGTFNKKTCSWFKINWKSHGNMFFKSMTTDGYLSDYTSDGNDHSETDHYSNQSWRGTVRVKWAA